MGATTIIGQFLLTVTNFDLIFVWLWLFVGLVVYYVVGKFIKKSIDNKLKVASDYVTGRINDLEIAHEGLNAKLQKLHLIKMEIDKKTEELAAIKKQTRDS